MYAESQDEKRPASYVLRDGLCHKVVTSFMHHTTDAVQSSLLAHLVSGLSLCLQRSMSQNTVVSEDTPTLVYVRDVRVPQHE